MRINWIALGAATVGGVLAAFFALIAAGAGHGTYVPAKTFFPWTMLLTTMSGDTITTFGMALALVEFPAYAMILGGLQRKRSAVLVLTIVHCVAVLAALAFLPNFPA